MAQLDSLTIVAIRVKTLTRPQMNMVIVEVSDGLITSTETSVILYGAADRLEAVQEMDAKAAEYRFTTQDRVWHDGKVTNARYRR